MTKQEKLQAAQKKYQEKQAELVNCERAVSGLTDQLFRAMKSRELVAQECIEAGAEIRRLQQ